MSPPYRISLVCTGNICRSPMAEAVLREVLCEQCGYGEAVDVDSFGTTGWHAGDPADPRALAALRRRGYDIAHQARRWRVEHFATRDLVVALDQGHESKLRAMAPSRLDAAKVRLLRSFDPRSDGSDLDVPDPYHGGAAVFDHALDLIEAACRGLADEVSAVLARR